MYSLLANLNGRCHEVPSTTVRGQGPDEHADYGQRNTDEAGQKQIVQLVWLHEDESDKNDPVDESPNQILCSDVGAARPLSATRR